jgi:hypothetical protein
MVCQRNGGIGPAHAARTPGRPAAAPSPRSKTSSLRSRPTSTAGTNAASPSPGPRPPTKSRQSHRRSKNIIHATLAAHMSVVGYTESATIKMTRQSTLKVTWLSSTGCPIPGARLRFARGSWSCSWSRVCTVVHRCLWLATGISWRPNGANVWPCAASCRCAVITRPGDDVPATVVIRDLVGRRAARRSRFTRTQSAHAWRWRRGRCLRRLVCFCRRW